MRSIARHAVACFTVLAAVLASTSPAATAERGHIVARAGGPVPLESTIAVRAGDADERFATLAQAIARLLEKQGFHVSDGGGLILEFRVADASAAVETSASRLMLEGSGGSGKRTTTEVEIEVRIEPPDKRRPQPRRELQIEFFLFAAGRPPIWSATVVAQRGEEDESRQLARMAELAIRAIGKTEDRQFDSLN